MPITSVINIAFLEKIHIVSLSPLDWHQEIKKAHGPDKTHCLQYQTNVHLYRSTKNPQSFISLRLQLHGVIYHPDSFVLMLRYCANLKAIRYESTSLKRIVADKSQV